MSEISSVLLVDDDEIANFIHQSILEEEGFADHVLIAANGKEALDLIREGKFRDNGKPALILLDINMPVMNGHEFLDAFNQLGIESKNAYKIIVLSSSDNTEDMNRAYEKGAEDYITKPLRRPALRALLNKFS